MKKVFLFLIIGLIFRLSVIPFTIHPDLRGHYLGSYFIVAKNQLFTFYDYISRLPRTDPLVRIYGDNFLVYSPLTYLFHAGYLKLIFPIFPDQLYQKLVLDMGLAVKDPGIYYLVFLLKLPYVFVDLACLWLMLKLVDPKKHTLTAVLWAFNLPVIYSAFLMGQFDILMVVFILLALLLSQREKPGLAAISLALAASFKPFPLFLIPFLPGNKLKNILIGVITFLLVIGPYLSSPAFRQYGLIAQHSDKMWFAKIMVTGSQGLPIFVVGLILLIWLNYYRPKLLPNWIWLSTPLLIFYATTHYHPQWFAWLTPFLFLFIIRLPKLIPIVISLLLLQLLVILSFENSLNFGLFGLAFYPHDFLNRYYPADQFMSLVRGALTASCLALIIQSFPSSKTSS